MGRRRGGWEYSKFYSPEIGEYQRPPCPKCGMETIGSSVITRGGEIFHLRCAAEDAKENAKPDPKPKRKPRVKKKLKKNLKKKRK